MPRSVLIVHHRVRDYDAWKAAYDGAGEIQKGHGVLEHAVLQDPEDPNAVVVVHTFADRAAAQAFIALPDLKAAMEAGGVDAASFRAEILDEVLAGRR